MPHHTCPYCGNTPPSPDATQCDQCGGLFEPLSRKATQLAMGPWFVRDPERPFMPGFNLPTLRRQVATGRITPDTIVRGPYTHQFWMRADQTPGLSRLLGKCHACGHEVSNEAQACPSCNADLSLHDDVDALGLAYVTPEDRAHAQQDVENQRTAAKASKPKPAAAKPKPKDTSTQIVNPDLMTPVAPPSEAPVAELGDPVQAPEQAPQQDVHQDVHEEAHDDLWEHAAAMPARRRRKKKNTGPDPLVLFLGILLLCLLAVGGIIILTSGSKDADDDDQIADSTPEQGENNGPSGGDTQPTPDPKDAIAKGKAEELAQLSEQVLSEFNQLADSDIPSDFMGKYDEIDVMIGNAKRKAESENPDDVFGAIAAYREAGDMIAPLADEIRQWRNQQARDRVNAVMREVGSLRLRAESAEAAKWSPSAWATAQNAWTRATQLKEQGEFGQALQSLEAADSSFQMSLGHALTARDAQKTRKQFEDALVAKKPSHGQMREFAGTLIDEMLRSRDDGDRSMTNRHYDEAVDAYLQAIDLLARAEKTVETARYLKLYAFQTGYQAAGVLLTVSSKNGIDGKDLDALNKSFDKLVLPTNPAQQLAPGADADFKTVSDLLVNTARQTLTDAHGPAVQASYQAGFQARIIDQTLASTDYTRDQQRRVQEFIDRFSKSAEKAGWETSQIAIDIAAVGKANLHAGTNSAPTGPRAKWDALMRRFKAKDEAAAIMTPQLWNGAPGEVEFFNNIGTRE